MSPAKFLFSLCFESDNEIKTKFMSMTLCYSQTLIVNILWLKVIDREKKLSVHSELSLYLVFHGRQRLLTVLVIFHGAAH